MKQSEVIQWEIENMQQINGWVAEWDVKPGFKVITFTMVDKSKVKFEIAIDEFHEFNY